jgi:hypothetical protein
MKIWKHIFSLCALAAAALPATAMYINPRGTGEVLLFPYYTVNAGQATLISLTNTTGKAKYLNANFREGYHGRSVIDFNIILAPYDSWTATLYSDNDSGAAVLFTRDISCTAPNKSAWTAIADGWQVRLFDRAYTAGNVDGGPTDLARTREGHLTVVERAELGGALADAAGQGGTRDCTRLQHISPMNAGLVPAGGGVYGNFSIVNVAQGTLLGGSATAIADFAVRPLFWDTADVKELLTLGASEPGGEIVNAQVFADGHLTEVSYPALFNGTDLPRPIDAVSALLMTEALYGDFERDDDYGARSEWVITAPTKFMYVDRKVLGLPAGANPARPPFRDVFGSVNEGGSCMPFTASGADREGRTIRFDPQTALSPPPLAPRYPSHSLCHAVDVVYFDHDPQNPYEPPPPLGQGHSTPVLGSRLGVSVWKPVAFPPNDLTPFQPTVGSLKLELGVRREGGVSWDGGGPVSGPSFLPPGLRGPGLRGLPVIGFQAVRYINANALPGVLANYTRALPLQSSVACTDANGAAAICP